MGKTETVPGAEAIAEEFGLRYLSDKVAGIRRERHGKAFEYYGPDNYPIKSQRVLQRIRLLVIPPAWEDVWISPYANSHVQSTGYDARGRKQYIYHPDWVKIRCETKFDKMRDFGELLPIIRKAVDEGLEHRILDKQKVVSAVVGLLDQTLIRIGNRKFELENDSYGLTTLKNKHIRAIGSKVLFEFKGKRGICQHLKVTDSKLAKVVRHCREIPGHQLFQYYDEAGAKHPVTSSDVNEYLKEITGHDISSKDFRTWGASTYAVKLLKKLDFPETAQEAARNFNTVVKEVAKRLGNTASVCRKHYLHPIVEKAYSDQEISRLIEENPRYSIKGSRMLTSAEKLFLLILERMGEG